MNPPRIRKNAQPSTPRPRGQAPVSKKKTSPLVQYTRKRQLAHEEMPISTPLKDRFAKTMPRKTEDLIKLTDRLKKSKLATNSKTLTAERELSGELIKKLNSRLKYYKDKSTASDKGQTTKSLEQALKTAQDYHAEAASLEAEQLLQEPIWLMDAEDMKQARTDLLALKEIFPKGTTLFKKLDYFESEMNLMEKLGTKPILSEQKIINKVAEGVHGYEEAQTLLKDLKRLNEAKTLLEENKEKTRPEGLPEQVFIDQNIEAINEKADSGQLETAKASLERLIKNHPDNPENIQRLFAIARKSACAAINAKMGEIDHEKYPRTYQKLQQAMQQVEDDLSISNEANDPEKLQEIAKKAPKILKKHLKNAKNAGILVNLERWARKRLQKKPPPGCFSVGEVIKSFKAHRNELLNKEGWGSIENKLSLPNENEVCSHITPAKQVLPELYDNDQKGVCSSDINSSHAVNLAYTDLTDNEGEVLWSATRHGVHCAAGINESPKRAEANKSRVREEIKVIWVGKLNRFKTLHNKCNGNPEGLESKYITEYNRLKEELTGQRPITIDALGLETASFLTKVQAFKFKYHESREDFNRNNEHLHVREQMEAWHAVKKERIEMPIPEDLKAALEVNSNSSYIDIEVKPITMNFGVNVPATVGIGIMKATHIDPLAKSFTGWADVESANAIGMAQLFTNSNIDFDTADDNQINESLLKLAQINEITEDDPTRAIQQLKASNVNGLIIQAIEEESDPSKQKAMIKLMKDVVHIFLTDKYKDAGTDPYKLVARLSVLGHMAGIHISFNCKSGKDRTGMLDAMSKFMAYKVNQAIENNDFSKIPNPDDPLEIEDLKILAKFIIETGNLEMQQYNTGVPGYKTGKKIFDKYFKPLKKEEDPTLYKNALAVYSGLGTFVAS